MLKYDLKKLLGAVLKKRCFENMQQIYRRTPMPKCDSIKLIGGVRAKQLH